VELYLHSPICFQGVVLNQEMVTPLWRVIYTFLFELHKQILCVRACVRVLPFVRLGVSPFEVTQ
jgi:hypothetical protein